MHEQLELVINGLLDEGAFLEVEAAVAAEYPAQVAVRVGVLCDVARRVADLDAEDFAELAAYPGIPAGVATVLSQSSWPRTRTDESRGALSSLSTTFGLLLEIIQLRLERDEVNDVLAVLHLAADYLPILAWQSVLGHAADPALLRFDIGVSQGDWRHEGKQCVLDEWSRLTMQNAVLGIGITGSASGWWRFITRQHSTVASALSVCAGSPGGTPDKPQNQICVQPCSMLPADSEVRAALAWRVELARRFARSPLMRLRHGSPVGHFFAVPDVPTLHQAWAETWRILTRDANAAAGNPLSAATVSGPLPGVTELFSAVAGDAGPVVETRVMTQLRVAVRGVLGGSSWSPRSPYPRLSESGPPT